MKQGLIVDDSAVIRRVTGRILELMGFASTEIDDGERALNHCSSAMPDLILLDWSLPNTDSIELIRKLRRLPGGNDVKIIYCPTENDPMLVGRALRAGADEALLKPIDMRALQNKLKPLGLIACEAQAS